MKVFEPEESIVNVSLPEIDFVPFHEPEALQDEAFDDDHDKEIESPTEIALSELEMFTLIDGSAGDPPPPPPPPHDEIIITDRAKNKIETDLIIRTFIIHIYFYCKFVLLSILFTNT